MNDKKCFVVKNFAEAKMMRTILDDNWFVLPAGSAVAGHRFSHIIFINHWADDLPLNEALNWATQLKTHLNKNGMIIGVEYAD